MVDSSFRAKAVIVFDDHDRRRHDIDRFPNPIVISVDVDRQQTYIAANPICADKIVYILSGDERLLRLQVNRQDMSSRRI